MNYELAKKLKDAGFPKETFRVTVPNNKYPNRYGQSNCPTLSELIKACGNGFLNLERNKGNPFTTDTKQIWWSCAIKDKGTLLTVGKSGKFGFKTPEEAVARLWIELNNSPCSTL